jgi:hypothetical protein
VAPRRRDRPAIDGENPSALEWLGTTAGIAALGIAVGIDRLQEKSGNEATPS